MDLWMFKEFLCRLFSCQLFYCIVVLFFVNCCNFYFNCYIVLKTTDEI